MKIHKNVSIAPFLWYKIGGTAKYVLEIASENDVLEAVTFVQDKHIKNILVIGLGSNLLFAKDYFDGAVLMFVPSQNVILVRSSQVIASRISYNDGDSGQALRQAQDAARMTGSSVEAFAGETLDSIIQFGFTNNLIGLEWSGGLPGTIGAAVRGNVGAFGGEIKDVIESAVVIKLCHPGGNEVTDRISNKKDSILYRPSDSRVQNDNLAIEQYSNSELNFSYRSSKIKQNKNFIISSVTFKLKQATDEELQKAKAIYRDNIAYREKNHPLDFPNCGSVFKNIHSAEHVQKILTVVPDIQDLVKSKWHGKVSMAYLINRLGFSGYRVGNAQVSEKHANFIVNRGEAKATDVLQIIETIQKKFQETFRFIPEVEAEITS